MASDAPAPEDTVAQVVEAAIAAGLAAALPVLAEAGVTCIDDIRRGPVLDGVSSEHLVQIVEASSPRPDAPIRRPAFRASFSAGLEAAQPANRKERGRSTTSTRACSPGRPTSPSSLA